MAVQVKVRTQAGWAELSTTAQRGAGRVDCGGVLLKNDLSRRRNGALREGERGGEGRLGEKIKKRRREEEKKIVDVFIKSFEGLDRAEELSLSFFRKLGRGSWW